MCSPNSVSALQPTPPFNHRQTHLNTVHRLRPPSPPSPSTSSRKVSSFIAVYQSAAQDPGEAAIDDDDWHRTCEIPLRIASHPFPVAAVSISFFRPKWQNLIIAALAAIDEELFDLKQSHSFLFQTALIATPL
nr:hypothetical protein Itr_chr03CG01680 [Ipomoea trifida]